MSKKSEVEYFSKSDLKEKGKRGYSVGEVNITMDPREIFMNDFKIGCSRVLAMK